MIRRHALDHFQSGNKESNQLVDKLDIPGVAVHVVKDGEIIHSKAYGIKSVISYQKVNPLPILPAM